MSTGDAELTIRDFRNAVRNSVIRRCAHELAQIQIVMDGAEYKRGVLTVRIDQHHGVAHVTYVALPTAAFGHSSGAGLPHRLTLGNVEAAATEVAARLQDRFCTALTDRLVGRPRAAKARLVGLAPKGGPAND